MLRRSFLALLGMLPIAGVAKAASATRQEHSMSFSTEIVARRLSEFDVAEPALTITRVFEDGTKVIERHAIHWISMTVSRPGQQSIEWSTPVRR